MRPTRAAIAGAWSAARAARRWLHGEGRPLALCLVCGPLLGAWIGFLQSLSAEAAWRAAGEPNFYFRGEQGVVLHYLAFMVGGGLVGLVYGPSLWLLEHMLRRRLRVFRFLLLMTLMAQVVFLAEAAWAMSRLRLPPMFASEGVVMAFGGMLLAFSRDGRRRAGPAEQPSQC